MAQTTEAAEYLAQKTSRHSDSGTFYSSDLAEAADLADKFGGLALQKGARSSRTTIQTQNSDYRSSVYPESMVDGDSSATNDYQTKTHDLSSRSFSGPTRGAKDQLKKRLSTRKSTRRDPSQPRGLGSSARSFDNLHTNEKGRRERRPSTGPPPPADMEEYYSEPPQMGLSDDLPQPQIPTKEALETYRQNAKKSHDPEVQLDFAKYLIETAALVLSNHGEQVDLQTARKLHNTLITEALKWIKRLSSQGIGLGKGAYPDAQFFLANCYNNGSLGLPVDHDKAFNLYVQASKQNHPAATYRTGVCYEFGAGTKRDHHRALQFFRKAAALGDTAAMFKVGMVLLKGGLGQQPNPREGITWLKRAAASADEENPHALHELASCYEKGGIPSIIADASYARELYTQAAQLGYAHSQFKMGVCYEQGLLTCPIDPRRSIAWFTRGAEQGDPECELALSGWYLTGSEGVLKQSDTEAYLWARKAADKGLAKAEYAVGYYSEVGIGAKQDLDEARRWFMRAAAQGNKRAMERLTELKKLGTARKNGPKSKEDAGCSIS